jgi:multicomponent Na+:H+ antiporter subunit E
VLLPIDRLHPAVVRIPLDIRGEGAVTALANMLTLTPGTVTIDVSDDTGYLYMHVMDLDDADAFKRGVKRGYERRLRRLLR